MKKIFFFHLFAIMSLSSFAQFEGILKYEDDYADPQNTTQILGKVFSTFYESKSKALVASRNITMKNGSLDQSTAKDQDTVLYDFDTQKQTILNPLFKTAVVSGMMDNITDQLMKITDADITVQNLGDEKIGPYSCTHFAIGIKKTRKNTEVWITKDLGTSNLFYVGPWLYYSEGSLEVNKLIATGGNGVVVKWKMAYGTATLTSAEKQTIKQGFFDPPKGYSVIQRNR